MTESNDLTFPPDASSDEINCDLNKKGYRERRPGLDYVTPLTTLATISKSSEPTLARTSYTWTSINGDGDTNFQVIQIGSVLYFFDHDASSPSAKGFTIDLTLYDTETGVDTVNVQFTSNKGYLFVAGEKINPFYVQYNSGSDTITVTALTIQIRDLDGVDDGLANDFRPTTLSASHQYNLYNQGWNTQQVKHEGDTTLRTPLAHWQVQNNTATEGFPSNADLWWSFQSISKPGSINLDLQVDRVNYYVGNSPAPRGYYKVNPFNINRSGVSGVAGVTSPASTTKRPQAIAAFAGRIWYGGVKAIGLSNVVYFSQLIKSDDVRVAADCYQQNDPTAEELNQLIDTDGGVIEISGAGLIQVMTPVEAGLLVMADNGIWLISGPDGVFKPGDFSVKKLSGTGIDNPRSVVLVEGTPYWWDKTGIKILTKDASGLNFLVDSISDPLIKSFYDNLSSVVRSNCKGAYDPFSQKIIWLYNETNQSLILRRGLVFDLRFRVFTPYLFADDRLIDVCSVPVLTPNNNKTNLKDRFVFIGLWSSSTNWLIRLLQLSDSTHWVDYYQTDSVGISYESYLETGPLTNGEFLRRKAAPIVFAMFNGVANSSCFLSTKWDFANSGLSNKYGTQFQAYRGLINNVSQVVSKHRVRGNGKAVKLRFKAEAGKNFQLTGWAVQYLIDDKY